MSFIFAPLLMYRILYYFILWSINLTHYEHIIFLFFLWVGPAHMLFPVAKIQQSRKKFIFLWSAAQMQHSSFLQN